MCFCLFVISILPGLDGTFVIHPLAAERTKLFVAQSSVVVWDTTFLYWITRVTRNRGLQPSAVSDDVLEDDVDANKERLWRP